MDGNIFHRSDRVDVRNPTPPPTSSRGTVFVLVGIVSMNRLEIDSASAQTDHALDRAPDPALDDHLPDSRLLSRSRF
ncbi:hypothetical protein EVAR_31759_1 [Eumeta japonica]|uniref:Uncharacterized protein n=1 Tax=Eumeta variegata TaxID=151549 RepID=A0A4C1W6R1_EUMVA|nr:hypothetical protein EVAR_31759_1 [Eumeta japonica]